jgi:hypothetical protein
MDNSQPHERKSQLAESKTTFAGKKVRIFSSFKEQEDEMVEYWASITPFQRLAHLYEMVKISFRLSEDEARHIKPSRKITIIKYGS